MTKTILEFFTALIWPGIFLIVFFYLKDSIPTLFKKQELTIEVAGFKLSAKEVASQLGIQIAELQERIAKIEENSNHKEFKNSNNKREVIDEFKKVMKVIWVDDYPSNNAFLIDRFQKNGIFVQLATSTEMAMKLISDEQYDIVISDLGRIENGIDNPFAGLDLIREIRRSDKDIPIVIFAGNRGLENEFKLKDAGASMVTNSSVDVLSFVEFY